MLWNTQNLWSLRGHLETAGLCCVGNTRKKLNEIKASGIDVEVNEIDTIIEELIRKEDAAVSTGGIDKKKVEERLDRKLMSRGLISYRRLVVSCSKMALDGSIIVEICDETIAKMWRKPVEM